MRTGRCTGFRVDSSGAHCEVGAGPDERIATRRKKTSSAYNSRISKTRKRDFVARFTRRASIIVSGAETNQTEKCKTEKWRLLFFCLTFFRLIAETPIKAARRKGDEHVQ